MTDWRNVYDQVKARLGEVDTGTAVAFSVLTAERLMRLDPQGQPFTRSLRPLLDLLWRAAAGDATAFKPSLRTGSACLTRGTAGPPRSRSF